MRKQQIDTQLHQRGFVHRIAELVGMVYEDLPSRSLIYGQNVYTLNMDDPDFHVVFEPTALDPNTWAQDIATLIKADKAFTNITSTGDLKDWALQIWGFKYLNIPQDQDPIYKLTRVRKALPNEPADADGNSIPDTGWKIRVHVMLVNVSNMGQ